MKRKLIKRNKQFLSSRYDKYCGGKMTFQYYYEYRWASDGYLAKERIGWHWSYSSKWVEEFEQHLEESRNKAYTKLMEGKE